jgi:hypothetical protein
MKEILIDSKSQLKILCEKIESDRIFSTKNNFFIFSVTLYEDEEKLAEMNYIFQPIFLILNQVLIKSKNNGFLIFFFFRTN